MIAARRIAAFFVLLLVHAAANAVDITAYAEHARSRYRLAPLDAAALSNPDLQVKLAFIYKSLAETNEVNVHRMRGATGNKVFLSPDGHGEAVYDEHGKLVTDCVNMASYNFFKPEGEPLEHFVFDMLPWIEFGNCETDPTSQTERITAYLADFRNGAINVFNGRPASLPRRRQVQQQRPSRGGGVLPKGADGNARSRDCEALY